MPVHDETILYMAKLINIKRMLLSEGRTHFVLRNIDLGDIRLDLMDSAFLIKAYLEKVEKELERLAGV